MAAVREVSDEIKDAGQPAGGSLTSQNLPASVSETNIVDQQPQSSEREEIEEQEAEHEAWISLISEEVLSLKTQGRDRKANGGH
ncbi:hypothetical protein CCACVL1_19998 [Corchorus capsularis]|uniref:Uncharacterized protein n=1 Tax=Corchorus capsularis TaxID=210143 RepID=A0A1R3HD77_COCAP|nr:hypothetical protein CCACVL1_19998 [Corchorus capsularis]